MNMNRFAENPPLFFFFMFASVYLYFFLHLIIVTKAADYYHPPENIVLSCGSSSSTPTPDGRTWTGDVRSKFGPFGQPNPSTTTSRASNQGPDIPSAVSSVPYINARISHFQFKYTFPVSSGQKFVRLHFYPATYPGFDNSKAFFSVGAGRFTLLHNFSASLTAEALNVSKIIREFCINVNVEDQMLNLTFTPSPNTSGAYAFVNGIEVVSMPTNLYIRGDSGGNPPKFVGNSAPFPIENITALEMVYRLNVGGQYISPKEDTGMFREWSQDDHYLLAKGLILPTDSTIKINYLNIPAYTAPAEVYRTARSMGVTKAINDNYNLTWYLPVDSGFNYLVRLHFCEFQPEVSKEYDREFQIFINNQTVEKQADVITWSGGNGIPVYKDYVVTVGEGSRSQQDILVTLHPNKESRTKYSDAILNGLEVFKLSDTTGNLAGPNPEPQRISVEPSENSDKKKNKNRPPIIMAGGVVGGVVVLSFLCCFFFWSRRRVKESKKTNTSSLPSDLCRHFTFDEIKTATNNFDDALVIGIGGFGNVYKGYIDDGAVAIKRLKAKSNQGANEFQMEIKLLSQLRHRHLVSLIGYCDENKEMILVYEYMTHGTLCDHLYNIDNPPLSWKQRLQICIGAAHGFHYLHTGTNRSIIHRDIKTANILLDKDWVAKVSDFGLSKMGPNSQSQTHVSTLVKGTWGYLDPEYYMRQQLTEKSDVYSFGVVLFEVLCGRPAFEKTVEDHQKNLANWARLCCRNKTLDQIIDPYLKGKIAPRCLEIFAEIANNCLIDQGIERPSMADVVGQLEFALQLQESAEEATKDCEGLREEKGEEKQIITSFIPDGEEMPVHDEELLSGPVGHLSESRSSGITMMTIGGRSFRNDDSDRLEFEDKKNCEGLSEGNGEEKQVIASVIAGGEEMPARDEHVLSDPEGHVSSESRNSGITVMSVVVRSDDSDNRMLSGAVLCEDKKDCEGLSEENGEEKQVFPSSAGGKEIPGHDEDVLSDMEGHVSSKLWSRGMTSSGQSVHKYDRDRQASGGVLSEIMNAKEQ